MRERFLLDTWLDSISDLKEAYEFKEEFYWIYDTNDPEEGRNRYRQWRHRCMANNSKDAYKDLVRAVDKCSTTSIKGSLTLIQSL